MKVQYKALTTEIKSVDEGDARKIAFTISTGEVDRDGDTIDPKGWQLDHYRKNPVILWHHDSTIPPVAKAESIEVKDGKLRSVAVFPPKGVHPFADTIFELTKGGWLNAASVGFHGIERSPRADKGFDYKKQELYEWSILPVPSHREALRDAKAAGVDIEPVLKWAREFLTKNGDDAVRKALADAVPAPPPQPGATTETGDHAGAGAGSQKYIKHEDGKWVVYSKDDKVLGKHDSEEDAKAQLAAVEAAKDERTAPQWEALAKGYFTIHALPFELSDEAGLAPFGDDAEFFSRCVAAGHDEGLAAHLHRKVIGKWPGELAAFVVEVKQPVPATASEDGDDTPRLLNEILAAREQEQQAMEAQWRLEDALRESLHSINEYADPKERSQMIRQTVDQFVSQYDAAKSTDEITALAKELFPVTKADPPPPPAPPADGAPPPAPAPAPDDEGSGIETVDAAYDQLWEDVKASLVEADPAAKANALKAALEAFAQVVMEAKPPAAEPPPPPPAAAPAAAPPGGEMEAVRAALVDLQSKAGRVLSGKNEARLRAALDSLSEILTSLPQAPEGTVPVDGDSTTPARNGPPKGLTDDELKLYMEALPDEKPPKRKPKPGEPEEEDDDEEMERMLSEELGTTKDGLREIIARAVKEGMSNGRMSHDGRLPD
jgi:hypothetical protein